MNEQEVCKGELSVAENVLYYHCGENKIPLIHGGWPTNCPQCRLPAVRREEPARHYPVDIAWIDSNDGCGPIKLQNSIRCF